MTCAWELAGNRFSAKPIAKHIRRFAFLPLLLLLCYYYFLNVQLGYYFPGRTQPAGRYYDPHPRNGIIVREFFANLAATEQAHGSRQQIQMSAVKINDWPIIIDTTVSQPPMDLRLSRRARVLAVALGLAALGYWTRRRWLVWFVARRRLSQDG